MNKKLVLLALPLFLFGCDTTELYPGDAYIDQDFVKNRYNRTAKEKTSAGNRTSIIPGSEFGRINRLYMMLSIARRRNSADSMMASGRGIYRSFIMARFVATLGVTIPWFA